MAVLIAAGCLNACGHHGGGGAAPTFTVGGNVVGLAGVVGLQLNGGADLSIGANTSFVFSTRLTAGSVFGVTVVSQPDTQTCAVNNGGGGMPAANVTNVVVSCSNLSGFSITDPLAAQQWHLLNTGQNAFADVGGVPAVDINVNPAFGQGYSGAGVTVAVVDTGLEILHEDLAANVVPGGSWNFNDNSTDPTNTVGTDGDHGTSVAGLIAMASNGVGGMGVAPRARLKGFNFLSMAPVPTEAAFLGSIGASIANPNSKDVSIFNQSFGIDTVTPELVSPFDEAQYFAGVTSLRGGKGALYVKAAGNGFTSIGNPILFTCTDPALSCENANFDPSNTLPYQIVVGAVAASGIKASYSTAGSAIWVSAPGGEFGRNAVLVGGAGTVRVQPAMVTTDQSSCSIGRATNTGANGSLFDNGGAPNTSCNYTNGMNGTSSATPVTAGVIALILEAKPALTWRDVKHILASRARQVDATRTPVNKVLSNGTYVAEPGWTTKAAGFNYHNWYGFGMVDAAAAVTMAKGYTLGQLGTFKNTGFISSATLSLPIPNNSVTGASNNMTVPGGTVSFIEAVQIRVSLTHPSIGDLGIELISPAPASTRSVLKNVSDGYAGADNLSNQIFLSNAFYGENPAGAWTIKVVDGSNLDTSIGTLTNWAIRVYGH